VRLWGRPRLSGYHSVVSSGDWQQAIESALSARDAANARRARRALRVIDATHVELDGRRYVNFASNNYLGLTHHPRLITAFEREAKRSGVGSGAAALVTGYSDAHAAAERAIAAWKGIESAVMLSSGYAANLAAVQTIAAIATTPGSDVPRRPGSAVAIGSGSSGYLRARRGGARFLLDKLVHASLVDAVRASGAEFRVFPHNHLEKLARLLSEADASQRQVVVTESIFSMDGDAADLAGIARLKGDHDFLLLLDEAHDSGVYGPNGAGYAAEVGLQSMVDISIVTLSKAIGVSGGAVCASRGFCEALVNFGRSFIYSTNVPPAVAAGVEAAIAVIQEEPQRQRRLREMSRDVRAKLAAMRFDLPAGDSPIIPVILGGEAESLAAAQSLREAGLLVVAIRPPTVPRGSSRLRITLSSEHTRDEIDALVEAMRTLR
jgi:8-amino-7-oxononanoate synthase